MRYVIRPHDDRVCLMHAGMAGNRHPLGKDELMHYRTKGSKNGVRRFQNEDGSLTPLGYKHYGIEHDREWYSRHAMEQLKDSELRKQADEYAKKARDEYRAKQTPQVKPATPAPSAPSKKMIPNPQLRNTYFVTPDGKKTVPQMQARPAAGSARPMSVEEQTQQKRRELEQQAKERALQKQQQQQQQQTQPVASSSQYQSSGKTGPEALSGNVHASTATTNDKAKPAFTFSSKDTKTQATPQAQPATGSSQYQSRTHTGSGITGSFDKPASTTETFEKRSLYNLDGTKKTENVQQQQTQPENVQQQQTQPENVQQQQTQPENVQQQQTQPENVQQQPAEQNKNIFQQGLDWLGGAWNDASKWVQGAANDVGNAVNGAVNGVGQALNNAGQAIGNAAQGVGQWVGDTVNNVGNWTKNNVIDPVAGYVPGLTGMSPPSSILNDREQQKAYLNGIIARNNISDAFNNAGQAIGNTARNVGDWTKNNIIDPVTGYAMGVTGMAPPLSTLSDLEQQNAYLSGVNTRGQVHNAVNNAGQAIGNAAQGVGQWVGDTVNNVGNWTKNNVIDPVAGYVPGLTGMSPPSSILNDREQQKAYLNGIIARNNISDAFNNAGQAIGNTVNNVGQAIGNAWNGITGNQNQNQNQQTQPQYVSPARTGSDAITGNVHASNHDIYEKANASPVPGTSAAAPAPEQQNKNIFQQGLDWLGGAWNDASKWAQGAANDVGNAVNGAVNGVGQAIGNAAQGVGQWVGDTVDNVGNWAQNNIIDPVTGYTTGLFNAAPGSEVFRDPEQRNAYLSGTNARRNIGNVVNDAGQAIGNAVNGVSQWAQGAANDVGQAIGNAWNSITGNQNQQPQPRPQQFQTNQAELRDDRERRAQEYNENLPYRQHQQNLFGHGRPQNITGPSKNMDLSIAVSNVISNAQKGDPEAMDALQTLYDFSRAPDAQMSRNTYNYLRRIFGIDPKRFLPNLVVREYPGREYNNLETK